MNEDIGGHVEGLVEIESKVAPPIARCAHCEGMLPLGLGEITCLLCGAICGSPHERTITDLRKKTPLPFLQDTCIAGSEDQSS